MELQHELSAKSMEIDQLSEKVAKEGSEKFEQLEKSKSRLDKEVAELSARLAEVESKLTTSEKTRVRLNGEVEDLRVELERQSQAARNAERATKAAEVETRNVSN